MPGKNPKISCEALEMLLRLRVQNDGKYVMQFNSKASNNIDFPGQYKFSFRIFLGKNIQESGGERPEALLPITISTTSGETNSVMTGSSFAEIQQANGRCLCPELCQKNHRMTIFEELQT